MPLDHHQPKIVTKQGHKKVRYCTAENNRQITVIGCVSVTGDAIAPFVIWDAKSMTKEWTLIGRFQGQPVVSVANVGSTVSSLVLVGRSFIPLAVGGCPLLGWAQLTLSARLG